MKKDNINLNDTVSTIFSLIHFINKNTVTKSNVTLDSTVRQNTKIPHPLQIHSLIMKCNMKVNMLLTPPN